jgi:hypothetical protein
MLCPQRQFPNVIPNVKIINRSRSLEDNLSVKVEKDPDALVFKDRVNSELLALVCGACGYTSLHAVDHDALWQAHLKAQGKHA